MIKRPLTGGRM
ncbi:hypothetical protein CFP56_030503 [Quercus suber]|uniref:Uncharacterized protein n=1 Tax=Quercus suber TaxID=58331 RepID=A0AAW0JMU4_QUESU